MNVSKPVCGFIGMMSAGIAMAAVPEVTSVTMVQQSGSRDVTITYTLANAPAVVTLDIQTNTTSDATGEWVSIGGENIQNFSADSDVWKRISDDGDHTILWHPDLSWPDHKIPAGCARAKVTAWALDNTPDYMVVDISATAAKNSQRYYPGAGFVPGGVVSNERYRTTALLMRKVMAKNVTWTMGSIAESGRSTGGKEDTIVVTTTNNYYIDVFQVTQAQWELITGYNNSYFKAAPSHAVRPVENLSYNEIRVNSSNSANNDYNWPHAPYSDSFLGKLNARTGLDFEMPTEAQWEYACRAGHGEGFWGDGSAYLGGSGTPDDNLPGRYKSNGGSKFTDYTPETTPPECGTAICGSYAPNSWGIYDMHGNVYEFCLDWYEAPATRKNGGAVNIDPNDWSKTVSGLTGSARVDRGGQYNAWPSSCRSAYRDDTSAGYRSQYIGFRPVCFAGLK